MCVCVSEAMQPQPETLQIFDRSMQDYFIEIRVISKFYRCLRSFRFGDVVATPLILDATPCIVSHERELIADQLSEPWTLNSWLRKSAANRTNYSYNVVSDVSAATWLIARRLSRFSLPCLGKKLEFDTRRRVCLSTCSRDENGRSNNKNSNNLRYSWIELLFDTNNDLTNRNHIVPILDD